MAEGTLRERWPHPVDASLAGIVAGIGLVFAWNQPAAALQHGGLAYLLAWLICLGLLGLPLWWLELAYGACLQASLPSALRRKVRHWAWVAWWGHGLLLILTGLGVLLTAWLLVRLGSEALGLVVGYEGAIGMPAEQAGSSAALLLGALLAIGLAALIARSRLVQIARYLRWGLALAVVFALVAVAVLAYEAEGRQGMLLLLQADWSMLGRVTTWTAAATHALATAVVGGGVLTMTGSLNHRDADTGMLGPLVLAGSFSAQILFTFLLAAMAGVQAIRPDGVGGLAYDGVGPLLWIWSPVGGPGRLLGHSALAIVALLVVGLWMLTLQLVWRDEGGERRLLGWRVPAAVGVVVVILLAVGPRPSDWFMQGIIQFGLPVCAIGLCIASAVKRGLGGLQDHLVAYSSIKPPMFWRPWVVILIPVLLVAVVYVQLEGLIAHYGQAVALWGLLGPSLLTAVIGTIFGQRGWLRLVIRYRLALVSTVSALLLIGLVAVNQQLRPIRSIDYDLEVAQRLLVREQRLPALASAYHPIGVIRRAVAQDAWRRAGAAAGLLRQRPLSGSEEEALADLQAELSQAALLEIERIPSDRRAVLHYARLLEKLRAPALAEDIQQSMAKADWFPTHFTQRLQDALAAYEIANSEEQRHGAIRRMVSAWRSLAWLVDSEEEPDLLLSGPDGLVGLLTRAEQAILAEAPLDGLIPGTQRHQEARAAGAWLVRTGLWRQLSGEEQAVWRIEVLPRRPNVLGLILILVLGSGAGGAVLLLIVRSQTAEIIIDPQAETLENVDPIDVDTGAVTMTGGYTTDANLASDMTTSADTDGGSTAAGLKPVEQP